MTATNDNPGGVCLWKEPVFWEIILGAVGAIGILSILISGMFASRVRAQAEAMIATKSGLPCRDGGTITIPVANDVVTYTLTAVGVNVRGADKGACMMDTYRVRVDHPEGWSTMQITRLINENARGGSLIRGWEIVFRKPNGDFHAIEISPWHTLEARGTRLVCANVTCDPPVLEVAP